MPRCQRFSPTEQDGQAVIMTVEEFECLRLMDYQGLTQEEAAAQLEVARTTVQAIYAAARKKIASALVEGRELLIEGGNYRLCEKNGRCGHGGGCGHHGRGCGFSD